MQLAGRLAHFSKNQEQLTQDQEILSIVKGVGGEGVLQTILESFSAKNQSETGATVFKTQELSIDKEIMKILDKGAIKNME